MKNQLHYRYQNWTFVSVSDTETWFRSKLWCIIVRATGLAGGRGGCWWGIQLRITINFHNSWLSHVTRWNFDEKCNFFFTLQLRNLLFFYFALDMDIFILDSYVVILFSDKWTSWGGGILGTQITPRDWIFWTFFLIWKIQVKIYLMSLLEVSHWVAQT